MKAYIKKNVLVKLLRENTIFTKDSDICSSWKWFDCGDGIITWDFVLMDKVLMDVEPLDFLEKFKQQKYEDNNAIIISNLAVIKKLSNNLLLYKTMNFWARIKFAFKGYK